MAAPAFVAFSSEGAGGAATDIILPAPAGVASGDFQLALIGVGTNSESITSVPSGWTLAATLGPAGGGADSYETWVYYSTTSTTEDTWVKSGTREFHGVRAAWENHGGPDTGQFNMVTTSAGTSHAFTAITPQAADDLVIVAAHIDGAAVTWTPPTNFTERVDEGSGTTIQSLTIADRVAPSTSAISGSFTSSGSDDANVFSMLLRKAPVTEVPVGLAW